MGISVSRLSFLLAQSHVFQARVQMILCRVASAVLVEQNIGATHARRYQYAQQVLMNPAQMAAVASSYIAQSVTIAGTITMEDEGPRTSATDAQLFTEITADWNALAGVDSGN